MLPEMKENLEDMLELLKEKIVELRFKKQREETELSRSKNAKRIAIAKERELRKKRGKMEKPLHVAIEMDIFPKYNINCSNYHGGAMEGPSIRRLMMKGQEVFDDISSFLKSSMAQEVSRDDMAADEEIENVCKNMGLTYSLLDACFSFVYRIKNRRATEEEKIQLKDRLQTLRFQWHKVGLSFTHKMHIWLAHLLEQIGMINGYALMGEDRIERNHQERFCDGGIFWNTRNTKKVMQQQVKA